MFSRLPLQLNIVQCAHVHFKRNRPKSWVHSVAEEMFTGQCSVVLPHPKILLSPNTQQGGKCSVHYKCPVVLPGRNDWETFEMLFCFPAVGDHQAFMMVNRIFQLFLGLTRI